MTDLVNTGIEDWKKKALAVGAVSGAALGLLTAYLLARSAEKKGNPPEISTKDLLSTGIAVIGVIRGIATLGDGK